jgi:hypothetical protein
MFSSVGEVKVFIILIWESRACTAHARRGWFGWRGQWPRRFYKLK